ncbi:SLC13 family permease [Magnetovibrio sp.]|uniref:SLC13 family permease n=1 Tax=Magnetovibrio sp. TaxID=2024836 RepID=UPI002F94B343
MHASATVAADFQMWVTFLVIIVAFALYAWEKVAIEVTSLGVLCVLMIFFYAFPIQGTGLSGTVDNILSPEVLLSGFSNPALITVLALLVIGQGMVRTGVLDVAAHFVLGCCGGTHWLSIFAVLFTATLVSGFLNNIPVVVIFIPIMQALADRFDMAPSKLMMPLSFAAILGGMTTLIGSGSNLLVNSALIGIEREPFGFFDFTVPGLVLAGVGLVYLLVVAPWLLPRREGMAESLVGGQTGGKQYIAQVTVGASSHLVGEKAVGGIFPALGNMTLRMVQRGEEAILPPFEDYEARAGDVLVVAATRKEIQEALARDAEGLYPDLESASGGVVPYTAGHKPAEMDESEGNLPDGDLDDSPTPWHGGERVLAEAMIPPASRIIGQTLPQVGFRFKTHCIVLGVQRRSRMIRTRMTEIRLQAGDVLLVQGSPVDVQALRTNQDVLLIEWSAAELPAHHHAKRAATVLLGVVLAAATGLVPIVIAGLTGAAAMVGLGVLNIRQAFRAVDTKILTMIPAALAMGAAMHATGGAHFVASAVMGLFQGAGPWAVLSIFFITMVVLTNVISSKAMAVLFTPIAVDLAISINAPVEAFAVAVVFAANCSFASPIGYQTNLLVMAPGHYRFTDFARAGVPLILLIWAVFSLFVPWWYGM